MLLAAVGDVAVGVETVIAFDVLGMETVSKNCC